jgi:CxxC motif-containing protein (DUF1111 family)
MKGKVILSITSGTIAAATAFVVAPVQAQSPAKDQRIESFIPKTKDHRFESFVPKGHAAPEGPARLVERQGIDRSAEAGYDQLTNGFARQGPDFDRITEDNVQPLRSYNDARFVFEEVERQDDGIGPTYNAQSCKECHQNVITGGGSQVAEHRTGHTENGIFYESMGGSLIQSRATYAEIVEHVVDTDETRTFRLSTQTLGNGYVECVADATITAIRDAQPLDMQGEAPEVPILESAGTTRIGRFGWKCQHGSLVSFAADAYLNEMGITSPLMPDENTSSGEYVGYGTEYDPVPEPENDGTDVEGFAFFMRSTKAPPRGEITPDVIKGAKKFTAIGCAVCHVATMVTADQGTLINGGAFQVPQALANIVIHPYSDFLLHDIGSGDGIPISPLPQYADTANKIRTAPLWGLRARNRLMHDGLSSTKYEAIERHAGQAANVTAAFNLLSTDEKNWIYAFLDSL